MTTRQQTGTQLTLPDLVGLPGETVVLMPSDASARQCRDQLARLRSGQDSAFIEQISVMPLEQWLAELWDGSLPLRQVLRPVQLLALARQVMEASEHNPVNCLSPLSIARQFVDAFQCQAEYQLPTRREDCLFAAEHQAFYDWSQALQAKLDQQQALSSQQLPAALLQLLEQGQLNLPDNVVLSEQLQPAPAAQDFLRACAEKCQSYQLARVNRAVPPTLYVAQQRREECEAVAVWVRDLLPQLGERGSIAVVVPEVSRYQSSLDSALLRYCYPEGLFPSPGENISPPWLFEGSEKILGFPLIRAAWDIISLTSGEIQTEQLSRVVRSRFVRGWPQHRAARAEIDLRWRDRMGTRSTLMSALALADKNVAEEPDRLAFIAEVKALLDGAQRQQLPSAWVRFFDQVLVVSGWPNADINDDVVAQCRRGFSQAMDVFRALDRQLGPVEHSEALSWLQHILASKRFSISRDGYCPVRVMSLDDARGRHFDALWIMGMDDSALPRRAEPSAFLPVHLQQQGGCPSACPALALQHDRQLLEQLLGAAEQVVLSYCRQDDGGAPRGVSALLRHLTPVPVAKAAPGFTCRGDLHIPPHDEVDSVSSGERSQLRGGTGLFKVYAQSPFLAFLQYRINLKEFPQLSEGLDHRVQGILVHDTLQYFWEQTRTSEALNALAAKQLQDRVESSVERALQHPELRRSRYGEALLKLEKMRLVTLVISWLEKEKKRLEAFEVVAMEELREHDFMGIPLRLRIDRIDRVGEHRLVIDYKTGTVLGKALNVDQLSEPQLPIYALVEAEAGERVDGVMLAQIKNVDALSIHMRSNWANSVVKKAARPDTDVDTPEKWQAELAAWQRALAEMAKGILAGDIRHDFGVDHRRSFNAYLLPLLRGEGAGDDADEALIGEGGE